LLDPHIPERDASAFWVLTDKAVNPANMMGSTKRLAEMLVYSKTAKRTGRPFMPVRFGTCSEAVVRGGPQRLDRFSLN
jgi:hypothetical protein